MSGVEDSFPKFSSATFLTFKVKGLAGFRVSLWLEFEDSIESLPNRLGLQETANIAQVWSTLSAIRLCLKFKSTCCSNNHKKKNVLKRQDKECTLICTLFDRGVLIGYFLIIFGSILDRARPSPGPFWILILGKLIFLCRLGLGQFSWGLFWQRSKTVGNRSKTSTVRWPLQWEGYTLISSFKPSLPLQRNQMCVLCLRLKEHFPNCCCCLIFSNCDGQCDG